MTIQELKVLLVEDDQNTRATIKAMLFEMGINQIFESADGKEADSFIESDFMEIDIIISDWNMPNQNGLEFLKKLREVKPDIPFIRVTGRADENSIYEAMNLKVTSYIRKPFSLKELENKIMSAYKTLKK